MKKFLTLGLLCCLWQSSLFAQNKTFTGDLQVSGYSAFEAFAGEAYTHIEGNLTITQSFNNLALFGSMLEAFPDALKSLQQVGGNLIITLNGVNPALLVPNLQEVDGNLETDGLTDVRMRKLRLVGGDFLVDNLPQLENLFVPRLEQIKGDLIMEHGPDQIRFPKLREIGGDLSLTNDSKTETIEMPALTEVKGTIFIEGDSGLSGPLKTLKMPRLKQVGGSMELQMPFDMTQAQTFNSLETVNGPMTLRGVIPRFPNLKEVTGSFSITPSRLFTGVTLSFPSLQLVVGDFIISGANNSEAIKTLDLPELRIVTGDFGNINTDNTPPVYETFNAPLLQSAQQIEFSANSFSLEALEEAEGLRVSELSASVDLSFEKLQSIGWLSLNTVDGAKLNSISAPELKIAEQIALNATALSYPKLTTLGEPSLAFQGDFNTVDFSSLKTLNQITLQNGGVQTLNLSSLSSLNLLSLDNIHEFGFNSQIATIDRLEIVNSDLKTFQPSITGAQQIDVTDSSLPSDFLSKLTSVNEMNLQGLEVGGNLNLSKLSFANYLNADLASATIVNLSALRSTGIYDASPKGLSFSNVSALNLSSLIQVEELKLVADNALSSVNLSSLKLAKHLEFSSNKLTMVDLSSLETAEILHITSEKLTDLKLDKLTEVKNLLIQDAELTEINLAALEKANILSFKLLPLLQSIDLGSLPKMSTLTLEQLPELMEIVTTKPGEEAGLITNLNVTNIKEEEVEITCDDGNLLVKTFHPALRKITLICETFEDSEGKPSSRAVIDQDIQYVLENGAGNSFDQEIIFPELSISIEEIDFGTLAEDDELTTRELTFVNTGLSEITVKLSLESAEAYSISSGTFSLAPTTSQTVTVTFSPDAVGLFETSLVVNAQESSRSVSLKGIKDGCIKIGELCIKALNVQSDGGGQYTLSNQVVLADFLKFTGKVIVDTNAGSISGNGLVYLEGIGGSNPLFNGKVELYQGEFEFNLLQAASDKLSASLQDGANNLLRLANLPIRMGDLEFIEGGIQFSAGMNLPPQLGSLSVELEEVKITSADGLELVGQVGVPGPIKVGGSTELKDLFFSFDTAEDRFAGGGTLTTKLFEIAGEVVMLKGGLDEVSVTIIPSKPIPVGPTGWSLTEGTGKLESLQNPPATMSLSVDMAPTATASFDLVKLNDLSLGYTFGQKLSGSGELTVLGQAIAKARMETRSRSILLEGEINFGDYLLGKATFSVDNASEGIRLRGHMEARLQIPNRDSFFYQVFDGAIGLPYTVASTEAWLTNTRFSGETTILGFSVAYGVAYVNETFEFDLAESHELLNQELFGDTGGGTANFENSLTSSRFEGKSLRFKPHPVPNSTNGGQASEGAEQTELSFNISRELKDIFIRIQHETVTPEFVVLMPDGTQISSQNAKANGVLFNQSETSTKQTFFAFKNPAMGEWKIMINSEDVEYAIDIAGADPEPSIQFGQFERDSDNLTIPWMLKNVTEDYRIHLLFDNNDTGFDGSEIVSNLANNTTSHEWDLSNLPTGDYYVYAELENVNTGVVKSFYAETAAQVVEAEAPDAPSGLTVTNQDIAVMLSWNVVEGASEYAIYYETNGNPGFDSPSFQSDQTTLTLSQLEPGKYYTFAVAAWNGPVQGELSEVVDLEYVSESLNNAPQFSDIANATLSAGDNYTQTLNATDEENDELTFILTASPAGMSLTGTALSWTPTDDQLGDHTIGLEVNDTFGNIDQLSFSIKVIRPNIAPTDISLSASTLNENNTAGTLIGSLTAIDEDVNDTHTFSLVTGEGDSDNASFDIVGNQLVASSPFDFETQPAVSVRIQTIDQAGNSLEKVFSITIENQNEEPSDILLSGLSIAENQTVGTLVAEISTTDPDQDDSHTYTLVEGNGDSDNTSFSIEGDQLLTAESFDFETKTSYEIRLQVNDAGGLSFEKTFTIDITDAADPEIRIVESALEFEPTSLNQSSTENFTIANDGDADLVITEISVPDGFSVSQQSLTIEPDGNNTIEVTFSPVEEKLYEGEIEVVSNAGTASISVSGEGAIITAIDKPVAAKYKVGVYPNPARDVITVDLNGLSDKKPEVKIFNASGIQTLSLEKISGNLNINVSSWQPGLYFIKILTDEGTISKKVRIGN